MITKTRHDIQTTPLGAVARFIRGITFTPEDKVEPGTSDSAVCMRTKNVQADLDESDLIAVPLDFVNREEQFINESDILVSTANSWNLVGKCSWVPQLKYIATAGGFISILRADQHEVFPRYLFYWFSSDRTQHDVRQCGRQTTNISNMSYERCLELEIPLPPLSEQKRIADILDKAHAIRRKRQETANLTRTLENALFAEMFLNDGNDFRDKTRVLDELCSVIRDGVHKTPTYLSEGVPFVTVKNLTAEPNGISFADCKFISPVDHAEFSKRTNPKIGDILVSKDGTIGVAREITGGLPFNIFVSVALLKPRRNIIHPTFLRTQFNMPFVQRQILDEIKGVAIRHLHLKDFKRLLIVVPEMTTQLEFVERIERLHLSEDTHVRAIQEADNLFNSLVQHAFNGEL